MSANNKKSIDPAVLAAIITVAGGIIVTLISTFGSKLPVAEPTPIPPTAVIYTDTVAPTVAPTDTVPAGDATSTPEPPTDTPQPLPTATLIPAGADWSQNCISSVWTPYPSTIVASADDKGCLLQPVDKFYTSGGRLAFTFNERINGAQTYGLFVQLPSDGTASLQFHLTQLMKGEIWIGIFSSPDANSNGTILVLPSGRGLDEQRMLLKKMPGQDFFSETDGPVISPSATYNVFFDFNSGTINVKLQNNQINLGTVPVISPDKWLFIGYQVLNGTNSLQADFFDLVIQPR